jgi:DNA repair ATPase RecN
MMGSALAFPARENGNVVRLVGTHLDREIINESIKTNKHPKFNKPFPDGVKYYQIEELSSEIRNMRDRTVFSPEELNHAIARMDLLDNLKKKYDLSIDGLIEYADELE